MSLLRRKGLFESTKVLFLPIAAISPNPDQPRTCFSREGLEELAASIQELGVLQPLSVRRSKNGGYELISGERRLRASRMAGLTEVPCILVSVDSQGSSLLALVENLQRRDLNFVEEATSAWPPGMWQSRGLLWPGRRSMWKPCFIRQTSPPAKNQPL